MKSHRVIVYMNLGPYHLARLRALTELLPDVHAIEVAAEQALYPWRPNKDHLGFNLTTLFPVSACENCSVSAQRQALQSALSSIKPTVVIMAGYREPVMREAAEWARDRGVPTVLLFVSTYRDNRRRWWRELLKRHIVRRYDFVAVTGRRAEEYALRLGVQREQIHRIGNVVDNRYYADCSEAVRQREIDERRKLGLPARYFVMVSRFSPEKNLPRLLSAFSEYRRQGGRWDLVLVGSGPQETELRIRAQQLQVGGVHFVGWKTHEELPTYYALASCLVLPSVSETWGLVVNEALACGLPVLVSENCGCVPELCHHGENGYTFDPGSTKDLAQAMLDISSDDERLLVFGEASKRIISSFTPQTWAASLRDCIAAALDKRAL